MACDPDLFRMAGQVDLYYWEQDNITDLCTPSCLASSSDWLGNIYDTCDGQTITIDSKMVPAESVAIRYSDGIGLACLTDMYECFHGCRARLILAKPTPYHVLLQSDIGLLSKYNDLVNLSERNLNSFGKFKF